MDRQIDPAIVQAKDGKQVYKTIDLLELDRDDNFMGVFVADIILLFKNLQAKRFRFQR